MRKSVEKNDRPDRSRNLSLSPLMHALLGAFRPARQAPAKAAKARLAIIADCHIDSASAEI